ncbi:hypothetical protein LINPERHAP2_LOCUS14113 [Linum perenne]
MYLSEHSSILMWGYSEFLLVGSGLALEIIKYYPNLVNSVNETGSTPLHVLAMKPNSFASNFYLGLFDRIIYYCTVVDEPEEKTQDLLPNLNHPQGKTSKYPASYQSCVTFFRVVKRLYGIANKICRPFLSLPANRKGSSSTDVENPRNINAISQGAGTRKTSAIHESKGQIHNAENQEPHNGVSLERQDRRKGIFPPNYETSIMLVKYIMNVLLVILGLGLWRINRIKEKKTIHKLATEVMNELVEKASLYRYDSTGRKPFGDNDGSMPEFFTDIPDFPDDILSADNTRATMYLQPEREGINQKRLHRDETFRMRRDDIRRSESEGSGQRDGNAVVAEKLIDMVEALTKTIQELKTDTRNGEEKEESIKTMRETAILTAAKSGVTEIIEKILDTFPVAIHDLDSDSKNAVLLAVEHRQIQVFKMLTKKTILKESVFSQLDKDGNSALHLAATFGDYRPWLIPGAGLQMQWEIKWYHFVEHSMPENFFAQYNRQGLNPRQIFTETHKDLAKTGSEWLTKTSESCSVVAALIATVAFATASAVPGGNKDENGAPILQDQPVFNVFAISSLVALCFSVTSLLVLLTIITSRFEQRDFDKKLPRTLLLGLTSLFLSIVSILVSFCAGHVFVLKDNLRFISLPIYAATCFPVALFLVAQLSLYFDLMKAIFSDQPQRSFKEIRH